MKAYAQAGESFYSCVRNLQSTLNMFTDYCDLEFNGITIRVAKDSNIDDLTTIYDLKHLINRLRAGHKD